MNNSWIVNVKEDEETGDYLIEIPDELLEEAGLKEGDEVEYFEDEDGNIGFRKVE
jgi:bifunctional DNA-binding transcriptional regulator/antitoxin component of YhaV-PrlF toxin-antitoxin module